MNSFENEQNVYIFIDTEARRCRHKDESVVLSDPLRLRRFSYLQL